MCKCKWPEGVTIKPDGVHELDPCIYETQEIWSNVVIIVSKCRKCGDISLSWIKTPDTEKVSESDWELFNC